MVCPSILVYIDGHVAGHLSAVEVALHEAAAAQLPIPWFGPPFHFRIPSRIAVFLAQVFRIHTGVHACAPDKLKRTFRSVGYGHSGLCRRITAVFKLVVKPHDVFPRRRIVDHLGALDLAPEFQGMPYGVEKLQHNAAILPVAQIGGCIERHTLLHASGCAVAAVLAIPVEHTVLLHYHAAVGIHVDAVVGKERLAEKQRHPGISLLPGCRRAARSSNSQQCHHY